jgi:hypothetical protein
MPGTRGVETSEPAEARKDGAPASWVLASAGRDTEAREAVTPEVRGDPWGPSAEGPVALAEAPGWIDGVLTDWNGLPLPGRTVFVSKSKFPGWAEPPVDATDETGAFRLDPVLPDTWTVYLAEKEDPLVQTLAVRVLGEVRVESGQGAFLLASADGPREVSGEFTFSLGEHSAPDVEGLGLEIEILDPVHHRVVGRVFTITHLPGAADDSRWKEGFPEDPDEELEEEHESPRRDGAFRFSGLLPAEYHLIVRPGDDLELVVPVDLSHGDLELPPRCFTLQEFIDARPRK